MINSSQIGYLWPISKLFLDFWISSCFWYSIDHSTKKTWFWLAQVTNLYPHIPDGLRELGLRDRRSDYNTRLLIGLPEDCWPMTRSKDLLKTQHLIPRPPLVEWGKFILISLRGYPLSCLKWIYETLLENRLFSTVGNI